MASSDQYSLDECFVCSVLLILNLQQEKFMKISDACARLGFPYPLVGKRFTFSGTYFSTSQGSPLELESTVRSVQVVTEEGREHFVIFPDFTDGQFLSISITLSRYPIGDSPYDGEAESFGRVEMDGTLVIHSD